MLKTHRCKECEDKQYESADVCEFREGLEKRPNEFLHAWYRVKELQRSENHPDDLQRLIRVHCQEYLEYPREHHNQIDPVPFIAEESPFMQQEASIHAFKKHFCDVYSRKSDANLIDNAVYHILVVLMCMLDTTLVKSKREAICKEAQQNERFEYSIKII